MKKNKYLKVDVNIRNHFGSNYTAIVFGRLIYWFSKKPEGFYKFKQACKKHPLYKLGDSWGEELGLSRKTLDPILAKLVNHHKTKGAYLKSTDRFGDKIFCSYTNHKTSQTHYFVNREVLDKFLESISVKIPPSPSPTLDNQVLSNAPKNMAKDHPSDVPKEHHLAGARLTAFNTQTITSFTEPPSNPPVDKFEEEKVKLISKEIVNTWNSQMNDQVVPWPSIAPKLYRTLQEYFNGNLEKWQKYCETLASNKYFAGKSSSTYKLFLFKAIKPDFLETMLVSSGIKTSITIPITEEKQLDIDIRHLANQLQTIEQKKSHIAEQLKLSRKKDLDQKIASLSPEQLAADRKEFDQEYFEKNPKADDWVDDKYSRMLLNLHFDGKDGFLRRKYGLANTQEVEYPPSLLVQEKNIRNALALKNNELNSIQCKAFAKKKIIREASQQVWVPAPSEPKERGLVSLGEIFSPVQKTSNTCVKNSY